MGRPGSQDGLDDASSSHLQNRQSQDQKQKIGDPTRKSEEYLQGEKKGNRNNVASQYRTTLCKTRSGHAKVLKDYQKRFRKTVSSDTCIYYEADAAKTIKQILCDRSLLEKRRARTFDGDVSIDMLTTHPDICRKILTARFKQLDKEKKLVEDEGGGSLQDCTRLQA